jgi:hypothetical protein
MSTQPNAGTGTDASAPLPWWRVPMVWLVWGLPALVVVASVGTGVIAWQCRDGVVPHGSAVEAAALTHLPAEENHLDVAKPKRR